MFSIVIPSHRRVDLLKRCLDSVRRFAPAGVQVVVVDDGSPDAIVTQTASQFPSVEIVRNDAPRGFAVAANQGIARAREAVIELLNDDTQITADWYRSPLRQFDDPTVGAVAPLVLLGRPEDCTATIDSAGDTYDRGGFARKRGHGQPLSPVFERPCEVFGASASSAFYRATALAEAGGFPADFGAYFEDVDLAWRLRKAGYRAVYDPASVVWHCHGASYTRSRELIERQSLNEERVFWRNVPSIWWAVPRHAAVLGLKAIRRLREGTFRPWASGRWRAFREVPEILAVRSRATH